MLLTPYRRTVQALLHGIPALRKPFLRRSLRPDALLTTDLPRLTVPESLAWLIAALEAQGWTALRQGDYLELTPGLVPPAPGGHVFAGADRPALRRLFHLLNRHPAPRGDTAAILALLKAEEAGTPSLEKLCQTLCRQCAVCLRTHERLPGELLPYVHHILSEEGEP